MAEQGQGGGAGVTALLTRPAAQGERFAAALAARFPGLPVVESPLLAPVFLRPVLPAGPFAAVAFSSETGVAAAVALGVALPALAFAVGGRTAAAAEAAGFRAVVAGGDAAALVACIAAAAPGPVLHLHGIETRGEVAAALVARGVPAAGVAVYDQRPQSLTPVARRLLDGPDAVLVPLFSPRSAALFAAAAGGARAALQLAFLSPAVAEAAAALPAAARITARRPDAAAMLDALAGLPAAPRQA
jgi:uroporphyrinogen-III synthase